MATATITIMMSSSGSVSLTRSSTTVFTNSHAAYYFTWSAHTSSSTTTSTKTFSVQVPTTSYTTSAAATAATVSGDTDFFTTSISATSNVTASLYYANLTATPKDKILSGGVLYTKSGSVSYTTRTATQTVGSPVSFNYKASCTYSYYTSAGFALTAVRAVFPTIEASDGATWYLQSLSDISNNSCTATYTNAPVGNTYVKSFADGLVNGTSNANRYFKLHTTLTALGLNATKSITADEFDDGNVLMLLPKSRQTTSSGALLVAQDPRLEVTGHKGGSSTSITYYISVIKPIFAVVVYIGTTGQSVTEGTPYFIIGHQGEYYFLADTISVTNGLVGVYSLDGSADDISEISTTG